MQLLQWVKDIAKMHVTVFISNCRARPEEMIRELRESCGIVSIVWLKAEVSEETDERGGRWIESSEQLENLREVLLAKYGL